MIIFKLQGLGINKDYFALKKNFFPFGYHTNFFYYKNTGDGTLEYKKLNPDKREQLILFFKENKIIFDETIEEKEEVPVTNKIANPSFYYYKDNEYGKEIEDKFRLLNKSHVPLFQIPGLKEHESFELTTIYPGIILGSGYNHPVIKKNGELDKDGYQLGFSFDHTTGLPVINGSSIKGLLKSVCNNKVLLDNLYGESISDNNIFEDDRMVFYDAYIVKTDKKNEGKIFGSDFITTHHQDKKMGSFMNPTPIKFLKILPDVTFKFQFKGDLETIALFKKIILDFGLGAKTNVGYGQFEE